MQKRKVDGEWVTELTKPEVTALKKASLVLQDLAELQPDAEDAHDKLCGVVGDIDEHGQYVPTTAPEPTT